jgi:hypothetical protein
MEKVQYTQSEQERFSILLDFFNNDFPVKFPHLEPPFSEDGHTTLCPPSAIILYQVVNAEPTLKKGLLFTLVAELDLNKLLVPKQVVQVVERQPSQQEKAEAERKAKREKFEKARDLGIRNRPQDNRNELDDEWDHGKPLPPPLTEQDRIAINSRNARIDQIIGETLSTIAGYTGHTHARTYSRRDELTALFNRHKDKVNDVESAEKLQRTIAAKIDSYDTSGSGGIR